jgi:hypothetical protein
MNEGSGCPPLMDESKPKYNRIMKLNPILLIITILALAICSIAQKTEPPKPESSKAAPTAAAANLPTVKDILDRYVKALGGREAIEKLKSRTAAGTVEIVPMNLKGTVESYAAPEGRSYTKTVIAGVGDIIEGSDGKTAWAVNPFQGSREKTGVELAQAKLSNDFYRDVRLEKLYPKMELKGIEKVGDRDAYVVVGSAEGVPSETWYFDTQTGLILRSDVTTNSPEGVQKMSVYLEDFRPVDGVTMPFRIRTQMPQFQVVVSFTEVKHGAPIDETKFSRPK